VERRRKVRRYEEVKDMKFKPLGERALVQVVEREQQTDSGIVLPDTAKEKPQTAEVVAVGQFENGVKVNEGDVIVFAKYSGTEINLDGEDYMILDADDILGIVES
jgi:chaperonin GroES